MPVEKVRFDVSGLAPIPFRENSFMLLLSEIGGIRRLIMPLDTAEAHTIALALEKEQPERSTTYSPFKELLIKLGYTVQEVLIKELRDHAFFAKMTLSNGVTTLTVDAWPSDGIAMALRFGAAIYIDKALLSENYLHLVSSGPIVPSSPSEPTASAPQVLVTKNLHDYSVDALKQILQRAVAQEDYEQAALLRDEINRRSTTKDK